MPKKKTVSFGPCSDEGAPNPGPFVGSSSSVAAAGPSPPSSSSTRGDDHQMARFRQQRLSRAVRDDDADGSNDDDDGPSRPPHSRISGGLPQVLDPPSVFRHQSVADASHSGQQQSFSLHSDDDDGGVSGLLKGSSTNDIVRVVGSSSAQKKGRRKDRVHFDEIEIRKGEAQLPQPRRQQQQRQPSDGSSQSELPRSDFGAEIVDIQPLSSGARSESMASASFEFVPVTDVHGYNARVRIAGGGASDSVDDSANSMET